MRKYARLLIFTAIAIVLITAVLFLFKYRSAKVVAPVSNNGLPVEVAVLLDKANLLQEHGDLIAARDVYKQLLYNYPSAKNTLELYNNIYSLNTRILFSSTPTPDSQLYQVAGGDTLGAIAKKFNTTVWLIKRANGLSSDLIKPSMKLKVQNNTFSIVVDKSQNTLTLISNGEVVKLYTVSTGKGNSTPIGNFSIVNKLIDPPWYSAGGVIPPDSPENVLGTRWLGIDVPGYGIHGTSKPESIGYQCTEGCVRMYNVEVEELYTIVPKGAEVIIID